jgi:hypothetical protein
VLGSAAAALLLRFYQAAAIAAKLAAAAAALPPLRCRCLRRCHAATAVNPALLPSCRRRRQAGRRLQGAAATLPPMPLPLFHCHRRHHFCCHCRQCIQLIVDCCLCPHHHCHPGVFIPTAAARGGRTVAAAAMPDVVALPTCCPPLPPPPQRRLTRRGRRHWPTPRG